MYITYLYDHDQKQNYILHQVFAELIDLHIGVKVLNHPVMSQVIPSQEES